MNPPFNEQITEIYLIDFSTEYSTTKKKLFKFNAILQLNYNNYNNIDIKLTCIAKLNYLICDL